MIDLLKKPSYLARQQTLDKLSTKATRKGLMADTGRLTLDPHEQKEYATIKELAYLAQTSNTTIIKYIAKHKQFIAEHSGRGKLLYREAAIEELKRLGVGNFGNGKFSPTDIAHIYSMSLQSFFDWMKRNKVPEMTDFKNGRPAWSASEAEEISAVLAAWLRKRGRLQ